MLFSSYIDQWLDKTINLGYFPDEDVDLIRRRAKVLTKKWRSITPRPGVEWVKEELKRRGIRVANSRCSQKAKNLSLDPPKESNGISIEQQIQSDSLLSSNNSPPRSISEVAMKPYTALVTNITGRKDASLESSVQDHSLMPSHDSMPYSNMNTTPTEVVSSIMPIPYSPDYQTSLTDAQSRNDDPHIVPPTFQITDYQVEVQVEGYPYLEKLDIDNKYAILKSQFEDHDKGHIGKLDIDKKYAILKRRYSSLTNERRAVHLLMNHYRNKRLRELVTERCENRNNENKINQEISMQKDSVVADLAPNLHLQENEHFLHTQIGIDQLSEMPELNNMHGNDNSTSVMTTIVPEDWR